jgi:Uncharacterised nucleotidyltransferase
VDARDPLHRDQSAREVARSEAGYLIDVVDRETLVDHLRERRLLALLGERILEIAGERAPQPFTEAIAQAIAEVVRRRAVQLVSIQMIAALEAAGIPSLPIKGALPGQRLYGQPGGRPSTDIDLLVDSNNLPRAVEIAKRRGYRPPFRPCGERGLRRTFPARPRERRVSTARAAVAGPSVPVSSRATCIMRRLDGGQRRRQATLADELVIVVDNAGDGSVVLRTACDLAAWWDSFGDGLPFGAVDEIIDRYSALERALLTCAAVGCQGRRLM